MPKKNENKEYRTYCMTIRSSNPFYAYCMDVTFKAKNMYNTAMYHIRQVSSCFWKLSNGKTPHLREGMTTAIDSAILVSTNPGRYAKLRAKVDKEMKKDNPTYPIGEFRWYDPLTPETSNLTKNDLDNLFAKADNPDYRALPSQTAQKAAHRAADDMTNWIKAVADWKQNPSKYKKKPQRPGYKDKSGRMMAEIGLAKDAFVEEDGKRYIKFPKIPNTGMVDCPRIDITKWSLPQGKPRQVRIVPNKDRFNLELVYFVGKRPSLEEQESVRIISIDPGEKNFACLTNNFGEAPQVIKGGMVGSLNWKWNMETDACLSLLYAGMELAADHRGITSKRIQKLAIKRNCQIKDFMHKASKAVVDYSLSVHADTIVIGKNKEQKQEINMGRKNNRKFVQIPLNLFNEMVKYKAEAAGIKVIFQEESYTSKSSFLDGDKIPVFNPKSEEKHRFSGKRTTRGTYKSKSGRVLNADVNGSANILRKAFPDMEVTDEWLKGICLPVRTIRIPGMEAPKKKKHTYRRIKDMTDEEYAAYQAKKEK